MTVFILILTVLIITAAVNIILGYFENEKYPAPGKTAEFDDTQLHIFSKGEKDLSNPTVLIIHDIGDFAPVIRNYNLIKKLSEKRRAVIVERSGSGWSGDTFAERSGENIVFEYRKALAEAREEQ